MADVVSTIIGATLAFNLREGLKSYTIVGLVEWAILALTNLAAGVSVREQKAELEMLRIHIRLNYTKEEYAQYNDYIAWYSEQLKIKG